MSDYKKILETESFVFGFVLNGNGGGVLLDQAENGAKPVWFHLDFLKEDCKANLELLALPEHAIDGLTRLDTRPRTTVFEEGILLILRVINLNSGEDPNDMVSLRLWIEHDRVISLRHKRVLSAQDIKEDLVQGYGPKNINEIVADIIERVADRVAEYVDSLEARMEKFEVEVNVENIVTTRTNVAKVRREAAMVRRFLAPQREALEALYRQTSSFLTTDYKHYVQELSDRITRYVEDLDLVREKAVMLQEELLNKMTQQQNDRVYVLSIIAAIFLPISFVTGLFGMNVAGLPGVDEPLGFAYVVAVMLAVVVGTLIYFRHKKWL